MNRAVIKFETNDPAASASLIHNQINSKILNKKLSLMLQRLTIHCVKHSMACAIRGGACSLRRWAFAKIGRHAPKWALIYFTLFRAREGHAPMFKLIDGLRRITT